MDSIFLICLKIFSARIVDVTIGTIRTVLTVKGRKYLPTFLAFFEVFIWFIIAKEALNNNINSLWIPVSYSLGYAFGTFLGTYVVNNYVKGFISIQVITSSNNIELIKCLRNHGYGVSVISLKKGETKEKKDLLLIQVKKKSLKIVTGIVRKYHPEAFVIINETKYVQNGLLK